MCDDEIRGRLISLLADVEFAKRTSNDVRLDRMTAVGNLIGYAIDRMNPHHHSGKDKQ